MRTNSAVRPAAKSEGRGKARTWDEPDGDFVHDIGDSGEEEENAGDQISIVDQPQLHTGTHPSHHGNLLITN